MPSEFDRRTIGRRCGRCRSRANTLARGKSGCRPLIVERLLDFLRLGIHPRVPEQGSVGLGDLARWPTSRCR